MSTQKAAKADLRSESQSESATSGENSFWKKEDRVFKAHKETIVRISCDIRNYEVYLKENEVMLEFSMRIEEPSDPLHVFAGDNRQDSYSIHWGKLPDQKELRLYYVCDTIGYELTELGYDPYQFSESRPVIEAPLRVRAYLRGFLPKFHMELTNYLEQVELEAFEPLPG